MPGADDTGLLARIATLEATVKSLMATNWTDRASVVDVSGNAVPLSSLAFGQVLAENPTVGAVSFTSVANASNPDSGLESSWTYLPSPMLDVLVNGGRMRVDWAAVLATNANLTAHPEIVMSYRVINRGANNDGTVNTTVVLPSRYRCIKIQNYGGDARVESVGTFAFHTGLTPGWYRVQAAFIQTYAPDTSTVASSADYPRIGVTPY